MPKRATFIQDTLDFTDFAYSRRDEQLDRLDGGESMEEMPPHIREAVADGLDQVRKGRFADGRVVEAILRRAGA